MKCIAHLQLAQLFMKSTLLFLQLFDARLRVEQLRDGILALAIGLGATRLQSAQLAARLLELGIKRITTLLGSVA